MPLLLDPAMWASLVTLTSLEIVLGVDNIVVLSILTSRLPGTQAKQARSAGLALALVLRLLLLGSIATIIKLTAPVFSLAGTDFSWRDLILIGGGLFLIFKATQEIHAEIEGRFGEPHAADAPIRFRKVIAQIAIMDLIFSLDSIVTAVGLAQDIRVMAAAVCIAVAAMYFAANVTSDFIEKHPTLKMLALAFLILVGVILVADGFGVHVPRVYIYVAMGFAGTVEALNIWAKSTVSPGAGAGGAKPIPQNKTASLSHAASKGMAGPQAGMKKQATQAAAQHRQKRGRKRVRRK